MYLPFCSSWFRHWCKALQSLQLQEHCFVFFLLKYWIFCNEGVKNESRRKKWICVLPQLWQFTENLLKGVKVSSLPLFKNNILGMHTLAFHLGIVISLLISSQIWACRGWQAVPLTCAVSVKWKWVIWALWVRWEWSAAQRLLLCCQSAAVWDEGHLSWQSSCSDCSGKFNKLANRKQGWMEGRNLKKEVAWLNSSSVQLPLLLLKSGVFLVSE